MDGLEVASFPTSVYSLTSWFFYSLSLFPFFSSFSLCNPFLLPPPLFSFSLPLPRALLEGTSGPCNCFQLQGKWTCLQDGRTWPIAWPPVAMVTQMWCQAAALAVWQAGHEGL